MLQKTDREREREWEREIKPRWWEGILKCGWDESQIDRDRQGQSQEPLEVGFIENLNFGKKE